MPKGVYVRTKPRSLEVRKRISETLKGRPSPMKGREHSLETRQKMSDASIGRPKGPMTDNVKQKISETKKGIPMSPENKAKIAASSKRGAEHHNWKGGTQTKDHLERVKFRKTMQQRIFQRDNYTCQICDASGVPIQVDHIRRWAEYPELRFDQDNCRTLCMACHYYVTFKKRLPKGVIWGHNLSRRISKLPL